MRLFEEKVGDGAVHFAHVLNSLDRHDDHTSARTDDASIDNMIAEPGQRLDAQPVSKIRSQLVPFESRFTQKMTARGSAQSEVSAHPRLKPVPS